MVLGSSPVTVTSPIGKAGNFPPDENVNIRSKISDGNGKNAVASRISLADSKTPLSRNVTTPKLVQTKLMLVYVNGISAGIKSKMKLLHNEIENVKADAGEKDKINLFILIVYFLETENNTLKNEISNKCLNVHSQVWDNVWQLNVLKKWWQMLFISPQKLFPFLKNLSFCLYVLVMYQNGLIKKIRLISNFMTSQPG